MSETKSKKQAKSKSTTQVAKKAKTSTKTKKSIVEKVSKTQKKTKTSSTKSKGKSSSSSSTTTTTTSPVLSQASIKNMDLETLTSSLVSSFESLSNSLLGEINSAKEENRSVSVKFLKSLNKNIVSLKKQTVRSLKVKVKKKKNTSNMSSGFLKPVTVSDQISDFTGWERGGLHSRVEVTKFICQYIKDNNLQNPKDKRQILPDAKLQKLLGYDAKKSKEPLRYYNIQTHLKKHFNV